MSDPFWRIRATGGSAPRQRAREALFSGEGGGLVRLRCRRCGVEASPRPIDLLRGLPWLAAPRPRYPLRGRCPVCRRRAWLGIRAGARSSSAG